jgi:hypothetical protein
VALFAGPLYFFQSESTVRVEQSLKPSHQMELTEMETQPLLLEQHPKSE